jgi:hypothetical protein
MQTQSITISNAPDGTFFPDPTGMGTAMVSYNYDMNGKTAIISFKGVNQALATFDETGSFVVSYTPLNLNATAQDMASVENILRHIAQPSQLVNCPA